MKILTSAAAKFFIIFLIFFSGFSSAQELIDLYKDLMPQKVQTDETLLDQASSTLEQCEAIHPELIYFYIEDLRAIYNGGDEYFLNLNGIIGSYEQKHRNWINKLKEEVSEESVDKELKEMCLDIIDDNKGNLRMEIIPIEWDKVDKNFMDFVVVRYLLKDKNFTYKPEEVYSEKRKVLEKIRASDISNTDNLKYSGEETVDKFFNNWLVYNSLNEADESFKLSDVLINAVSNIYDIKYKNHFTVSIGYSYQNDFISTGETVYGTPLYGKSEYQFSILPFSASMNYKFFNSKYMGLFYYLNLQLTAGYGKGKSEIETFGESSIRKTNVDGIPNRTEVYDFTSNKIKIGRMFFAAVDLTAALPIYFFNKDLLIDFGAGAVLFNTAYDLYYDYSYRKFEPGFIGPRILKTETGSDVKKENTSTGFLVYPVINFKYYFMNPLLAQLGITTNSVFFNIGINL